MSLEVLFASFITLLVVVDPVALIPAFLAVTKGASPEARRAISMRACLIAATILIGAALGGDWLFNTVGISLSAFRIAGGLLLFSIAFEMVFDVHIKRQSETAEQALEERTSDVAAFPLAIPLMAGPGAITAVILAAGRTGGDAGALGVLIAVICAVLVICYCAYLASERIARAIGVTGNIVLSRLLGVLLSALAIQYIIDGVTAAFVH